MKKRILRIVLVCGISIMGVNAMFAGSVNAAAKPAHNYAERDDVKQFIDEMVKDHGFERADLERKFASAKKLDKVLAHIAKPAEKELNWGQYRPIFVTKKRADKGKVFMKEHSETLARAEEKYGVPAEIIAAIIGVESYYGRHTGKYTIFDSLTTLGFDYPPRSKFFKRELKQFLLLSKEENISIDDMTGSYAGAMGMPQFISSSYRRYAVDFDADGKRDLWNSIPDVIGSVANYFSEHGWVDGGDITYQVEIDGPLVLSKNKLKPYATIGQWQEKGVRIKQDLKADDEATLLKFETKKGDEYWIGLKNFYVITRYNHNEMYALAVFQLSEKLKS